MLNETQRVFKDELAISRYEELKKEGNILFEAIVGSQAYGTAIPTSDIDKKFVYIEPFERVMNQTYSNILEVNKDYNGFEIGRYLDLLRSQNPNIHELLWQNGDTVLYCHP